MLSNQQINDIMEMLKIQLERVDDEMTRLAISSSMSNYLNLYK
jgi:hypothetical protein